MSAPRLYWPDLTAADSRVELIGDDAHRLRQVLRLKPGDAIALFDGRGHERTGLIERVTKSSVSVNSLEPIEPVAEARVPVTLAFGVLKGEQMDAVVRDATMLGVAAMMPLRTAHVTVPSKAWKSGAAVERWRRVAIASATQCRRAVVPSVRPVTEFDDCLREPAVSRLICVEPGRSTRGQDWRSLPRPVSVQLLIGPEGGWSEEELQRALAGGAIPITLGPRTLRAETAPIVALSLISAAWESDL